MMKFDFQLCFFGGGWIAVGIAAGMTPSANSEGTLSVFGALFRLALVFFDSHRFSFFDRRIGHEEREVCGWQDSSATSVGITIICRWSDSNHKFS